MATALQNLQTAFQHHQSGNFYQAEQLYRQVLQQQPSNADAWHLFGVLSYQIGSSELAIAYISEAISINSQNPDFYNNLAEAYRSLGNYDAAIENYKQAIRLKPDYAKAYANLGLALQSQHQVSDAIANFQKALELDPSLASVHNNLGVLLKRTDDLIAAIEHYQQAIQIQPQYTEAHLNLGTTLQALGQTEAAIQSYQNAIATQPSSYESYNNLGTAFAEIDDLDAAITAYNRAINLKIDFAEAYYNLGHALQAQGKYDEAIANYNQAALINHTWVEVPYALGNLYRDQGRTAEALAYYQMALQVQPQHLPSYWNQQLILPVLYDSVIEINAWRERFSEGLENLKSRICLDTPAECQLSLAGVGSTTNFYLQYQGQDDRELQSEYGQIVQQIMAANYPQWSQPLSSRSPKASKLRIGYLSHHLHNHTVAKLFLGWLKYSDRHQFEIYSYYTGKKVDSVTEAYKQSSDVFRYNPFNLTAACEQIIADQLDVLVFLDLGMEPETNKLAGLRLAPVQCLAWGHPITSGLPTIDYFISSDLMEPEQGEQHYTEKLIRLPKIGIAYPHPQLPATPKTRADLQLSSDAVIYLSCQSLYKYLPQYDYIFPAIAQQVSQARFVFLSSPNSEYITNQFEQRLYTAFSAINLDYAQYCRILPRLSSGDYLSLNLISDVFLDTIDWSGGNTTLEAIACNLPIVTLPGKFMRGRHAYAMLQALGVTDTIASTEIDYIEIAVKLGTDSQWREQVTEKIHTNHVNLYEDKTCVAVLEAFFQQIT